MLFRQIADERLAQYAYLIGCQRTGEALVIDPERDVDRYLDLAAAEGLRITAVAETHIHADFLSGAQDLADRTGARLFLSAEGEADGWGSRWAQGRADVTFLRGGDRFRVGNVAVDVLHTPGHTPEHVSFVVTDEGGGASEPVGLVSGDFVFVGDVGRPDLLETAAGTVGAQEPAARKLYGSVQAFLELPEHVQVWPGHGAGSACGKALGAIPQSTVGYEKRFNGALDAARRGEDAFVGAILDGQPEPPLYFARMKRLNRDGVPALSALPDPGALAPDALPEGAVVLDTRADRSAFMGRHLPGALHAPLDKSFNTTAASYVTDPSTPIVLLVDAAHVGEAVRALVRVGLDRVVGYVTPDAFERYADAGGATGTIPEVRFERVVEAQGEDGVVVVDVRRREEYAAGHAPGAVHAPHVRLPERIGALPRGARLLVHCQSGVRSAVASALLAREGFDVTYVNDAFPRYREMGPVERGTAETPAAAEPAR